MFRALFALAVVAATGCATPAFAQQSGMDFVRQAIAAAGGEQALRALKTLRLTGNVRYWEPDQSIIANGPSLQIGSSKFVVTLDLENSAARTDWDRTFVAQPPQKYAEIVTRKLGFVADQGGSRAMSGIRFATLSRELDRWNPLLLLRMLDSPADVAFEGGLKIAAAVLPSVTFKQNGTTFHVLFNKITKLPAAVRTYDEDAIKGTVIYDVAFDNWKPMPGGAMVPHFLTYSVSDNPVARVTLTAAEPNPAIEPKIFSAGADLKANPVPASIPYQWVIRRLNIGRFLDSDDIFVPRGGSLKLTELAPNVHHITGGTHNGLAVVMKDGIVVFDAPTGDAQSRWTIDTLKAKFGKPVKSVVLTHHHSDHSAGVRVYIAERAGLVVPSPDRKFFALLSLSQRPVPDELESKHISADITEVKDRLDLKDESVEIRLYRIPNSHAEGMLIAHIMPGNIVYETDLWTPGSESGRTPAGITFAAALKKLGIQNATVAGGHGAAAAPQAEFDRIYATPAIVQ
jgi:glyoxylase-like metal-dependent hydrolase (beta-lactamase superfamily II)